MRVLVTGSRTWTDRKPIEQCLDILLESLPDGDELTVVHGGAQGADTLAATWASDCRRRGLPVRIERHRAHWSRDGRSAGIVRNVEMVRAGADLCLAFIRDGSKGASHCARIAEQAGIETRTFLWQGAP